MALLLESDKLIDSMLPGGGTNTVSAESEAYKLSEENADTKEATGLIN
jgi:hypothetical protein